MSFHTSRGEAGPSFCLVPRNRILGGKKNQLPWNTINGAANFKESNADIDKVDESQRAAVSLANACLAMTNIQFSL
jgi:hypothetical protein